MMVEEPPFRPSNVGDHERNDQQYRRNLRIAIRQLERAELDLVALYSLNLEDRDAEARVDDLINRWRALERHLLQLKPRGDLHYRSYALWRLGLAAWRDGDSLSAVRLLRQALVLNQQLDDQVGAARRVDTLARVAASMQEHRMAATLVGAANAIADAAGLPAATPPYVSAYQTACEQHARRALGEEGYESAFEDGMKVSGTTPSRTLQGSAPKSSPALRKLVDQRPGERAERVGAVTSPAEERGPVVRILVVDRHRVVADGIQMLLDQPPDLQVVGVATSATDALKLASETNPTVIVADYQLADKTGAELAARLRKEQPASQVLLLSSVVSNALLQEAVKAGARGFLLKTEPAEQLVDAVRRAAAGEMLIPAARLAAFLVGSDEDAQLFDQLTGRERDVLRQLAAGLDNKQIAAQMGIGYVTVRSHLRNLSSKLDAHSKVEVLARALELGLIAR